MSLHRDDDDDGGPERWSAVGSQSEGSDVSPSIHRASGLLNPGGYGFMVHDLVCANSSHNCCNPIQSNPRILRFGRSSHLLYLFHCGQIIEVEDDANHQAAAGAHGNIFSVSKIRNVDLEAVAAGTRVMIEFQLGVKGQILDFNLVVDVQIVRRLLFRLVLSTEDGTGRGCSNRRRVGHVESVPLEQRSSRRVCLSVGLVCLCFEMICWHRRPMCFTLLGNLREEMRSLEPLTQPV